jgi:hypothetical protein
MEKKMVQSNENIAVRRHSELYSLGREKLFPRWFQRVGTMRLVEKEFITSAIVVKHIPRREKELVT